MAKPPAYGRSARQPRRPLPLESVLVPTTPKRRSLQRKQRATVRHARLLRRRNWRVAGAAFLTIMFVVAVMFVVHNANQGSRFSGTSGGLLGSAKQGTNLQLVTAGTPAHGQTVDGIECYPWEGVTVHLHIVLDFYANGHQGLIPPGIGIVAPLQSGTAALSYAGNLHCIYPIHVHVADDVIHVESNVHVTYTLGQLFALWGQPLSQTQVAGYTADRTHPLVFEIMDAQRKVTTYRGDPRALPLTSGETIAILYNTSSFQLVS